MNKLLLYCTKAKPYIIKGNSGKVYPSCVISDGIQEWHLNGKIVAECDFEVDKLTNWGTSFMIMKYDDLQESYRYTNEIARGSCLDYTDLRKYLETNDGYVIHIKNLHIFDKPKELSNYLTRAKEMNGLYGSSWVCESIDKAPQNMMYAQDENQNEQYILISIRPEWLCKILNGEKTIEVRKKVLKEMLK